MEKILNEMQSSIEQFNKETKKFVEQLKKHSETENSEKYFKEN